MGKDMKVRQRNMTDKQRLLYGARIRLGWFMEAERLGSVVAACRSLGVPRRTYYYWHKRWIAGKKTLVSICDQPKVPHSPAKELCVDVMGLIVGLRLEKMYGEDALVAILNRDFGVKVSKCGVNSVLKRFGLLTERKKRVRKQRKLSDYIYYPGEVLQLDVKHWGESGFQYDIIDCCTRIKFKYVFEDYNVNTTVKFLEMATRFYEPAFKIVCIQTDNGSEFTNNKILPKQTVEPRLSAPERWLLARNISFKHIPVASPHLNGRIERSHGVDKWRYKHMTANRHRLEELQYFCIEDCLDYNTYRPHSMLGYKTPLEFLQSIKGFEHATIDTSVLSV
jgi:transposase InsO family protein